jgi:hypothetical protein
MKLIKESLNEFERGLEPKVALGIGRYAWKTLRPYTILKSLKTVHINMNGFFRNSPSYLHIWPGMYVLLSDIAHETNNYILCKFNQFWDLEKAINATEENNRISKLIYNHMQGSILQFKNRFEIIRLEYLAKI